MKANKTGLARIFGAFFYSADGFASAFRNEAAFRQELVLYIFLLPVLYFLPISLLFKCLLFSANTMVLIVELLNSAVESIVDLVSPDYNIYAKRAKDMGSAAVLLSLLLAATLWTGALFDLIV